MTCIYCNEEFAPSNAQIGAGGGDGQEFAHKVCWDIMQLGRECAWWYSGPLNPDEEPQNLNDAWQAIKTQLNFAINANQALGSIKTFVDREVKGVKG